VIASATLAVLLVARALVKLAGGDRMRWRIAVLDRVVWPVGLAALFVIGGRVADLVASSA